MSGEGIFSKVNSRSYYISMTLPRLHLIACAMLHTYAVFESDYVKVSVQQRKEILSNEHRKPNLVPIAWQPDKTISGQRAGISSEPFISNT